MRVTPEELNDLLVQSARLGRALGGPQQISIGTLAAGAIAFSTVVTILLFVFLWTSWLTCGRAIPVVSSGPLRHPQDSHLGGPQWDRHFPAALYRTYYLPTVGPYFLFTLRATYVALVLYTCTAQYFGWGSPPVNSHTLHHLTSWTFFLFGTQGFLGLVVSLRGAREIRRGLQNPKHFDVLDQLYAIIYTTSTTTETFLTLLYWTSLHDYTDPNLINFDNLLKHGGVTALLLLEVLVSRIPFTSSWIVFPAFYVYAYSLYLWVDTAAITDEWKYPDDDANVDSSLMYTILIPLLNIACYILVFIVAAIRDYLFGRHRTDHLHASDRHAATEPLVQA